jgi:hypothetical protein
MDAHAQAPLERSMDRMALLRSVSSGEHISARFLKLLSMSRPGSRRAAAEYERVVRLPRVAPIGHAPSRQLHLATSTKQRNGAFNKCFYSPSPSCNPTPSVKIARPSMAAESVEIRA